MQGNEVEKHFNKELTDEINLFNTSIFFSILITIRTLIKPDLIKGDFLFLTSFVEFLELLNSLSIVLIECLSL